MITKCNCIPNFLAFLASFCECKQKMCIFKLRTMTADPIRIEGKMDNAQTNFKISFTLLHFPFHQAPDCSLSSIPRSPTPAPRPNTLYICRDAFELESAFINITLFNRFRSSLTLWYYHPHCNMKNLKLRQIKGVHKVIQSIH